MDVGGWEVVEGGLEVIKLGDEDVSGGWEMADDVAVDDIGGGVDDGGVEGTGGEDDGIEFGVEVTDGNSEEEDGGGGGGSLLDPQQGRHRDHRS